MPAKLSDFEKGMSQLEDILAQMSDSETTLEESIALYARAAGLIAKNGEILKTAQVRIEEIDAQMEEILSDER